MRFTSAMSWSTAGFATNLTALGHVLERVRGYVDVGVANRRGAKTCEQGALRRPRDGRDVCEGDESAGRMPAGRRRGGQSTASHPVNEARPRT